MKKKIKITDDELFAMAEKLDRNDLLGIVKQAIRKMRGPLARRELSLLIAGTTERPIANLATDRSIPLRDLEELANSPMVGITHLIIKAALEEPMQTRELMLRVIQLNGDRPIFFLVRGTLSKKHKTQFGYILSMAGFERRSHYDRHTRKPIKAWKTTTGASMMSAEGRKEMVEAIISDYTKKPKAVTHLEDLI